MIESVEGFRLSPQQEHLWSLQQLDRNTPYRVQVAALIEGDLNIAQLQEALERVVTRHESLRTNFQYFAGLTLPVQVIGENRMSWTATHDLSSLEVDEQQARLDALFEAEKSNAFDLQNGPLLHASLVRLSISRNVLLLGLPAVSTDLQGLKNLVGEVLSSYKACLLGEGPLAEPIQYADISEYLNELLEAEETESGRRYWGSGNGAEFFELKLPFEVQQAGQTEFEPKFVTLTIRPQLRARVEAAARRHQTTVAVFLLTCWQALLWRLTGQSEIVIGTAFSGRKVAGLEELPGLFAKYLPLTGRLEGEQGFDKALRSVQESLQQLAEWQDYFDWKRWLAGNAEMRETRFFSVCFDYADEPGEVVAGGADLSVSVIRQYACIDRFKIRLSVTCEADSLGAEIHYDSRLFTGAEVECFAELLQTLVESASDNPTASLTELEMLSAAERRRLVVDFNNTAVDYSGREAQRRKESPLETR